MPKRTRVPLLALIATVACGRPPAVPDASEQRLPAETGDLVFFDLDCGPPCDAIEDVTLEQFRVNGPRLSHVGIVVRDGSSTLVLEAWPSGGVRLVDLSEARKRARTGRGILLARIRPAHRPLAIRAATEGQRWLGRPYDELFRMGDDAFYCSELVLRAWQEAKRKTEGMPMPLRPQPMVFGTPGSSAARFWSAYYTERKQPIPEGELGVSPLGLYLAGSGTLFDTPEELTEAASPRGSGPSSWLDTAHRPRD